MSKNLSENEIKNMHDNYVVPTYSPKMAIVKGKGAWQPLEITLYDPVVPSAAQSVMEWIREHHESVTGRQGYSDFYKRDITFNLLGPVGDIVEEWTLKGAYIEAANFGTMDYATSDPVEIGLTLKYDYAILQF